MDFYWTNSLLNRMGTDNEKWIVFNNFKHRRLSSKSGDALYTNEKGILHKKVVCICILKTDKEWTINLEKCLFNNKCIITRNRPEATSISQWMRLVLHQENARWHVPLATRRKLLQLGWEVFVYTLYYPDHASFEYHFLKII